MSDLEKAVDPSRRSFIKRLVLASAFAVPVVSSFTMMGSQAVFGAQRQGAITGLSNSNTTIPPDRDDDDEEEEEGDPGENGTDDEQQSAATQGAVAAESVSAAPKFTG